ncbi:MAG: hypothetical protein EAZ15_05375 [Sphingobacteriales bacterium]|nr:MAG: hypothetical protein EAZ15_05375 [Sphingobacteriales bacterium]
METIINIKVLDPNWLEMTSDDIDYLKSIKEPEDIDNMKYKETVSFTFGFDIIAYTINRNTTHNILFTQSTLKEEFLLSNLTVVSFNGTEETAKLIISNDLLYGNFDAQKSGKKQYFYFYINGSLDYEIISNNIWLTRKEYITICDKFPSTYI